jgi:hypothetical protein
VKISQYNRPSIIILPATFNHPSHHTLGYHVHVCPTPQSVIILPQIFYHPSHHTFGYPVCARNPSPCITLSDNLT